jgi:uncharacterized protein YbcI
MSTNADSGDGQVLTDLSNALVALHREQFGRGPGAAKTVLANDVVVCVLTDVFTPVERTLIDAGEFDAVRRTRTLHAEAVGERYRAAVEAVLGRRVEAFVSAVHADPDVSVETFLLAKE